MMRAMLRWRRRRQRAINDPYTALWKQVASQVLPRWQRWLLWVFAPLLLVATLTTPPPTTTSLPFWAFTMVALVVAGVLFVGIFLFWVFCAVVGFDRAATHAAACANLCGELGLTNEQIHEVGQRASFITNAFTSRLQLPLALAAWVLTALTTLPVDQTWKFALGSIAAGMLAVLVFFAHNFYVNSVIGEAVVRYQGRLQARTQLVLPYGVNMHEAVRRYVPSGKGSRSR